MYYQQDEIINYKAKIKNAARIIAFLAFLTVASLVLLACFTKDSNATIFKFASIGIVLLGGNTIIYQYINNIKIPRVFIKKIEAINSSSKQVVEGRVLITNEIITISKYEKATIIKIQSEHKDYQCYFSSMLGDCPLADGKKYRLTIASNYITDFEEIN